MKSLVVFLYRFLRKEGIQDEEENVISAIGSSCMYVVEDVSGADVDKYHYEINFLPEWGVKVTHKQ